MTARCLVAFGLALAHAGCAIGPNFERPAVEVPAEYRGAPPPDELAAPDEPAESPLPEEPLGPETGIAPDVAASLADLPWWEVFEDPILQELVTASLEGNYDLRVAVARTEQARYQAIATRSAFFPQVDYKGSGQRSRYPITLLGSS
ncbi:MAG: TolC family protein, partial [Myxococcota bacterium]